jgi:transposase-like protein
VKRSAAQIALQLVILRFADPDAAEEFVVRLRWPNGVACPRPDCGAFDVARLRRRHKWRCRRCQRQFSVKVNTIFEDSPIGFDKWLPTIWVLSDSRNAVSSCELSRSLGVTQKTAWSMMRRLRGAMDTSVFAAAFAASR